MKSKRKYNERPKRYKIEGAFRCVHGHTKWEHSQCWKRYKKAENEYDKYEI